MMNRSSLAMHRRGPQGRGACIPRSAPSVSARTSVCLARSRLPIVVSALQQEQEEALADEVDPMTGMPISRTSIAAQLAGRVLQAGKYKWAYRRSEPVPEQASPSKLPVLLLHGLGSSSYCFRTTLGLLASEGYDAIAPDWIGHGDSDKPESGFDFSEQAYIQGLSEFIAASGIKQPFALIVHGYVLGQYGLLYAQQHPEQIERLMVLNTPLATNSKLRPELAAYKSPLPFLRPGNKPFDGFNYNASGSPYAMAYTDASVFGRPYTDSPAASLAISKTMDKLDFNQLLNKVDQGFKSWRQPTAICFGSSDPFLDVSAVFDFLDSKRTNMKAMSIGAKMGHMPQEDYPEALHDQVKLFLSGTPEEWSRVQAKNYKMTKKGMVQN